MAILRVGRRVLQCMSQMESKTGHWTEGEKVPESPDDTHDFHHCHHLQLLPVAANVIGA
jgi:hypothetical protein